MRMKALVFALALSACGQTEAPAPPPASGPAPSVEEAPSSDDLQGPFIAVSTTAMSITGDMSYSDADISFMNGILLHTTPVTTGAVFDAINSAGDSYDDLAPGEDNRIVELRRVTAQELSGDARTGVCSPNAPTYVAIAHDIPITKVALIAFTGANPPGPSASGDNVCATFSYEAQ